MAGRCEQLMRGGWAVGEGRVKQDTAAMHFTCDAMAFGLFAQIPADAARADEKRWSC